MKQSKVIPLSRIISDDNWKKLRNFLFVRESDIAYEIENFGELKDLFEEIFEAKPKKD